MKGNHWEKKNKKTKNNPFSSLYWHQWLLKRAGCSQSVHVFFFFFKCFSFCWLRGSYTGGKPIKFDRFQVCKMLENCSSVVKHWVLELKIDTSWYLMLSNVWAYICWLSASNWKDPSGQSLELLTLKPCLGTLWWSLILFLLVTLPDPPAAQQVWCKHC